jgi:hypothetical protein
MAQLASLLAALMPEGASTPVLMKLSGHTSVRSLANTRGCPTKDCGAIKARATRLPITRVAPFIQGLLQALLAHLMPLQPHVATRCRGRCDRRS